MVVKGKISALIHPLASLPRASLRRRTDAAAAASADEFARLRAERDELRAERDELRAERDELRRNLLAAHGQAEAAERAKSVFLAHMSHELRTPLNAVIGFAELIRSQIHGAGPTDKYKDYASDIVVSGRHLLFLIDSLLDMSRSQSEPHRRPDAEAVAVAELVADILRALHESGVARHLDVEAPAVDATLRVLANPAQLRQALCNLLANAAKFTPAGGRIRIAVERAPEGGCAIAIVDNGIGIPPAELARLATAFGASDGWRRRANVGSGFGLTLARAFAEANGARLEIESEPGRGTCVTLRFAADRVVAPPT